MASAGSFEHRCQFGFRFRPGTSLKQNGLLPLGKSTDQVNLRTSKSQSFSKDMDQRLIGFSSVSRRGDGDLQASTDLALDAVSPGAGMSLDGQDATFRMFADLDHKDWESWHTNPRR